jgi:DNA helicase II / ATP-dependent DNA helicase PcrA
VFLTGLEEGMFPHFNSSGTEKEIEEERRLCYVGITRARDRIYLSSAEIRRTFGDISYKQPSRFIEEIPDRLLHATEYFSEGRNGGAGGDLFGGYRGMRGREEKAAYPAAERTPDLAAEAGGNAFNIRDDVVHPKFGAGSIIGIEGSGDNRKLIIRFRTGGKKTFLQKYTPLEKID